jgi:hypothetical protein
VLAEVHLSRPLKRLSGEPMESIRFVRAPAMGELIQRRADGSKYFDPAGPDDFEAALERLLVDPEWIGVVLSRCAGVPKDQYERMAFEDYAKVIPVVADFIGASRGTGE